MNCPNCGKENPEDAQFCRFCNASMTETLESKQPVTVTISKLASFSLTFALCGCALIVPSLVAFKFPRTLSPRTDWVVSTSLIGQLIIAISLVLGIISIIRIERSGGKITGRAFAVASVLVAVFAGIFPVWFIILRRPRSIAFRMVCGTNLSHIGKMMLIYASDYDEKFPRSGGKNSIWSNSIPDWQTDNRFVAFGLNEDGTGGRVTITSSFYLLAKYAELDPKCFICNKEKGAKKFRPSAYVTGKRDIFGLSDFGSEPRKHCSYSYHLPYGPFARSTSSEPGSAVAADPSPWMKAPTANPKNIANFDPDGDREKIKAGNAITHKEDGQNVLFMDIHVSFEKNSFCGIDDDNIYTHWEGQDIRRGAIPNLKSQPSDRLDSMLVNDLP